MFGSKLSAESAVDGIRRDPPWRELSSSLLTTAVAEVQIRADEQVSGFGLGPPASTALNGAIKAGYESSGDVSSNPRCVSHEASRERFARSLRNDAAWRHVPPTTPAQVNHYGTT